MGLVWIVGGELFGASGEQLLRQRSSSLILSTVAGLYKASSITK